MSQITGLTFDSLDVHGKMLQLNESQTHFYLSADPLSENPLAWPEYLSKFNVLLSKHTNLSNSLAEPKLRKTLLYPKEFLADEQDLRLRTLLRTKQIPEIEESELKLKFDIAVQEGLWGQELDAIESKDKITGVDDEEKWEALLIEWKKIYEEHDMVCQTATSIVEDLLTKENMEGSKRLSDPLMDADEDDEMDGESKKVPPPIDAGAAMQRDRMEQECSLEDVLDFMSSGIKNGRMPLTVTTCCQTCFAFRRNIITLHSIAIMWPSK
ncbi:hypothetical protein G9A89_011745 [Geosiphon pyriformis]|nr:hypothetical protein G9A89_011745 [Geosiphon pyriformis]